MDIDLNGSKSPREVAAEEEDRECHRKIVVTMELSFFGRYAQAKRHILQVAQQIRLFAGNTIHVTGYTIEKGKPEQECTTHDMLLDHQGKLRCLHCGKKAGLEDVG